MACHSSTQPPQAGTSLSIPHRQSRQSIRGSDPQYTKNKNSNNHSSGGGGLTNSVYRHYYSSSHHEVITAEERLVKKLLESDDIDTLLAEVEEQHMAAVRHSDAILSPEYFSGSTVGYLHRGNTGFFAPPPLASPVERLSGMTTTAEPYEDDRVTEDDQSFHEGRGSSYSFLSHHRPRMSEGWRDRLPPRAASSPRLSQDHASTVLGSMREGKNERGETNTKRMEESRYGTLSPIPFNPYAIGHGNQDIIAQRMQERGEADRVAAAPPRVSQHSQEHQAQKPPLPPLPGSSKLPTFFEGKIRQELNEPSPPPQSRSLVAATEWLRARREGKPSPQGLTGRELSSEESDRKEKRKESVLDARRKGEEQDGSKQEARRPRDMRSAITREDEKRGKPTGRGGDDEEGGHGGKNWKPSSPSLHPLYQLRDQRCFDPLLQKTKNDRSSKNEIRRNNNSSKKNDTGKKDVKQSASAGGTDLWGQCVGLSGVSPAARALNTSRDLYRKRFPYVEDANMSAKDNEEEEEESPSSISLSSPSLPSSTSITEESAYGSSPSGCSSREEEEEDGGTSPHRKRKRKSAHLQGRGREALHREQLEHPRRRSRHLPDFTLSQEGESHRKDHGRSRKEGKSETGWRRPPSTPSSALSLASYSSSCKSPTVPSSSTIIRYVGHESECTKGKKGRNMPVEGEEEEMDRTRGKDGKVNRNEKRGSPEHEGGHSLLLPASPRRGAGIRSASWDSDEERKNVKRRDENHEREGLAYRDGAQREGRHEPTRVCREDEHRHRRRRSSGTVDHRTHLGKNQASCQSGGGDAYQKGGESDLGPFSSSSLRDVSTRPSRDERNREEPVKHPDGRRRGGKSRRKEEDRGGAGDGGASSHPPRDHHHHTRSSRSRSSRGHDDDHSHGRGTGGGGSASPSRQPSSHRHHQYRGMGVPSFSSNSSKNSKGESLPASHHGRVFSGVSGYDGYSVSSGFSREGRHTSSHQTSPSTSPSLFPTSCPLPQLGAPTSIPQRTPSRGRGNHHGTPSHAPPPPTAAAAPPHPSHSHHRHHHSREIRRMRRMNNEGVRGNDNGHDSVVYDPNNKKRTRNIKSKKGNPHISQSFSLSHLSSSTPSTRRSTPSSHSRRRPRSGSDTSTSRDISSSTATTEEADFTEESENEDSGHGGRDRSASSNEFSLFSPVSFDRNASEPRTLPPPDVLPLVYHRRMYSESVCGGATYDSLSEETPLRHPHRGGNRSTSATSTTSSTGSSSTNSNNPTRRPHHHHYHNSIRDSRAHGRNLVSGNRSRGGVGNKEDNGGSPSPHGRYRNRQNSKNSNFNNSNNNDPLVFQIIEREQHRRCTPGSVAMSADIFSGRPKTVLTPGTMLGETTTAGGDTEARSSHGQTSNANAKDVDEDDHNGNRNNVDHTCSPSDAQNQSSGTDARKEREEQGGGNEEKKRDGEVGEAHGSSKNSNIGSNGDPLSQGNTLSEKKGENNSSVSPSPSTTPGNGTSDNSGSSKKIPHRDGVDDGSLGNNEGWKEKKWQEGNHAAGGEKEEMEKKGDEKRRGKIEERRGGGDGEFSFVLSSVEAMGAPTSRNDTKTGEKGPNGDASAGTRKSFVFSSSLHSNSSSTTFRTLTESGSRGSIHLRANDEEEEDSHPHTRTKTGGGSGGAIVHNPRQPHYRKEYGVGKGDEMEAGGGGGYRAKQVGGFSLQRSMRVRRKGRRGGSAGVGATESDDDDEEEYEEEEEDGSLHDYTSTHRPTPRGKPLVYSSISNSFSSPKNPKSVVRNRSGTLKGAENDYGNSNNSARHSWSRQSEGSSVYFRPSNSRNKKRGGGGTIGRSHRRGRRSEDNRRDKADTRREGRREVSRRKIRYVPYNGVGDSSDEEYCSYSAEEDEDDADEQKEYLYKFPNYGKYTKEDKEKGRGRYQGSSENCSNKEGRRRMQGEKMRREEGEPVDRDLRKKKSERHRRFGDSSFLDEAYVAPDFCLPKSDRYVSLSGHYNTMSSSRSSRSYRCGRESIRGDSKGEDKEDKARIRWHGRGGRRTDDAEEDGRFTKRRLPSAAQYPKGSKQKEGREGVEEGGEEEFSLSPSSNDAPPLAPPSRVISPHSSVFARRPSSVTDGVHQKPSAKSQEEIYSSRSPSPFSSFSNSSINSHSLERRTSQISLTRPHHPRYKPTPVLWSSGNMVQQPQRKKSLEKLLLQHTSHTPGRMSTPSRNSPSPGGSGMPRGALLKTYKQHVYASGRLDSSTRNSPLLRGSSITSDTSFATSFAGKALPSSARAQGDRNSRPSSRHSVSHSQLRLQSAHGASLIAVPGSRTTATLHPHGDSASLPLHPSGSVSIDPSVPAASAAVSPPLSFSSTPSKQPLPSPGAGALRNPDARRRATSLLYTKRVPTSPPLKKYPPPQQPQPPQAGRQEGVTETSSAFSSHHPATAEGNAPGTAGLAVSSSFQTSIVGLGGTSVVLTKDDASRALGKRDLQRVLTNEKGHADVQNTQKQSKRVSLAVEEKDETNKSSSSSFSPSSSSTSSTSSSSSSSSTSKRKDRKRKKEKKRKKKNSSHKPGKKKKETTKGGSRRKKSTTAPPSSRAPSPPYRVSVLPPNSSVPILLRKGVFYTSTLSSSKACASAPLWCKSDLARSLVERGGERSNITMPGLLPSSTPEREDVEAGGRATPVALMSTSVDAVLHREKGKVAFVDPSALLQDTSRRGVKSAASLDCITPRGAGLIAPPGLSSPALTTATANRIDMTHLHPHNSAVPKHGSSVYHPHHGHYDYRASHANTNANSCTRSGSELYRGQSPTLTYPTSIMGVTQGRKGGHAAPCSSRSPSASHVFQTTLLTWASGASLNAPPRAERKRAMLETYGTTTRSTSSTTSSGVRYNNNNGPTTRTNTVQEEIDVAATDIPRVLFTGFTSVSAPRRRVNPS